MATILNKLPRELRNHIYRELLVDDTLGLELIKSCFPNYTKRKQLSPAILQVCKQVYVEASIILYEENIFCYAAPRFCGIPDHFIENNGSLEWTHGIPVPPSRKGIVAFGKIKHLELSGWFAIKFTVRVMRFIAETGCSLKTLRLSWKFRDFEYSSDELDGISLITPGDEWIPHAVAALEVQEKIEITVNSKKVGHYKIFEAIASEIGSLMQWATNKTKKYVKRSMDVCGEVSEKNHAYEEEKLVEGSLKKNFKAEIFSASGTDYAREDSDIAQMELKNDIGIHYVWTWTLTPTATMVGGEGSETARSLN